MSLVLRSASRPQSDTDSALLAAGAAVSVEWTQWDLSAPAPALAPGVGVGVGAVVVQLNISAFVGVLFLHFSVTHRGNEM